ncbi:MAG TPA: hypothetical protein VF846_16325 [Thermoanaerobaculia bacterium]|jgi:putative transposase
MYDWPHAPAHNLGSGTFFITGATYQKQPFYRDAAALDELRDLLFRTADQHRCWLQAWSLLANHYHVVLRAEQGESAARMIARFHTEAAIALNRRDGVKGRKVWFQYWDKTLTFPGSWLARLRYTHENAVHHRLVHNAADYPWCSASTFERSAPRSFVQTVRRMKIDALKVYDDFECGGSAAVMRAVATPPHS